MIDDINIDGFSTFQTDMHRLYRDTYGNCEIVSRALWLLSQLVFTSDCIELPSVMARDDGKEACIWWCVSGGECVDVYVEYTGAMRAVISKNGKTYRGVVPDNYDVNNLRSTLERMYRGERK